MVKHNIAMTLLYSEVIYFPGFANIFSTQENIHLLNLWIKAKIHVMTLWGLDFSPGCSKQKDIMSFFDYNGFSVCGYVGIKVYEFIRAKKFM